MPNPKAAQTPSDSSTTDSWTQTAARGEILPSANGCESRQPEIKVTALGRLLHYLLLMKQKFAELKKIKLMEPSGDYKLLRKGMMMHRVYGLMGTGQGAVAGCHCLDIAMVGL